MPAFDPYTDYQIRQLWRAMSPQQQRVITKLAERALQLDRAATHAYELGRLDDAELLDEEATRTLQTLEETLAEVESESGDLNVDDESDLMREFAHLYERYMRGSDPNAMDGLDADDYTRIARDIIYNADESVSDEQLLTAGHDAYERLRALGRLEHRQRDIQEPRTTRRCIRCRAEAVSGRAKCERHLQEAADAEDRRRVGEPGRGRAVPSPRSDSGTSHVVLGAMLFSVLPTLPKTATTQEIADALERLGRTLSTRMV